MWRERGLVAWQGRRRCRDWGGLAGGRGRNATTVDGAEGSCRANPERSTSGILKVYSKVRKRRRRSARASGGSAANVVGVKWFVSFGVGGTGAQKGGVIRGGAMPLWAQALLPGEVARAGEVVNLRRAVSAVARGQAVWDGSTLMLFE